MGRTLTSEERKALLDALIDEMLFLQLCDRDGIRVSDAEIDAAIAQMRAQLGENVSDEQFSAYLSSQGASTADLKSMARLQLLQQKWITTVKAAEIRAIPPVTANEILSNYELLKAQLVQPESARVAFIYYPFQEDTQAERDKGAKTIREISDKIAKGESFDSLRLKAAQGSYGASRDLLVPKTSEGIQLLAQAFGLGKENFDLVFSMKDGTVSAPFQTSHAWWILRKYETFPQKQLELSDPIQPGQQVTVQSYIAQLIAQQRQQEFLVKAFSELRTSLRSQAEIKILGKL